MTTNDSDLEFPEETIKLAREIGRKYRARDRSKLEQARSLFDSEFFHIRYGFSEALRNGSYAMFLHEIAKEAECFALAGAVLYPIAKETGLKPKIVRMYGMQDLKDGENPDDKMVCDHSFIICDLGKRQQVVDRFMSAFGRARFLPDKHILEIYDERNRDLIRRSYAHMQVLSEKEFLRLFKEAGTPEGNRRALGETQRVRGAKWQVYVTYLPDSEELKTQVRFDKELLIDEPRNRKNIKSLITSVNEDGSYNFNEGRLEFFSCAGFDWAKARDPQVPLICPVPLAQNMWNIWEEVVKSTGRKAPVSRLNLTKLRDILYSSGFPDSFTPLPRSQAERIMKRKKLAGDVKSFRKGVGKVLEDYIERCSKEDHSFRFFLRECHRVQAKNSQRSKNNPWGFIFSEEDHRKYLEEAFEAYQKDVLALMRDYMSDAAIRAKLVNKSLFHQDRIIGARSKKAEQDTEIFKRMVAHRRNSQPQLFESTSDFALFNRQIEIDSKSVENLSAGLTEEDLMVGAEASLFGRLLSTYRDKDTLFLASFKKGLTRMLDRR